MTQPRALSGGGAEAWSKLVSEKKGGEELEPASGQLFCVFVARGGLRSQERAECRGRSTGCVMMQGTAGRSMQTRPSSREQLMEEREGRTTRAGPLRGGGGAQGQVERPALERKLVDVLVCVKSEPAGGMLTGRTGSAETPQV